MLETWSETIREYVKKFWDDKIHYLQLHYAYIAVLAFITSGLYYCQPGTQWDYMDALFTATTAATNTGLNTIPMSHLSTYQKLVMYVCSFFASHITISVIVLLVRKHYFQKRFEDILVYNKTQRLLEENRRRFNKNMADMQRDLESQSRRNSTVSFSEGGSRRRHSLMSTRSMPGSSFKKHMHSRSFDISPLQNRRMSGIVNTFRKRPRQWAGSDDLSLEMIEPKKRLSSFLHPFDTTFDSDRPPFTQNRQWQNSVFGGDTNDTSQSAAKDPYPAEDHLTIHLNERIPNTSHGSQEALIYTPDKDDGEPSITELDEGSTSRQSYDTATTKEEETSRVSASPEEDTHTQDTIQSAISHDSHSEPAGIAFAEDIEKQREIARRRLEQERKYDELLREIIKEPEVAGHAGYSMDGEDDDEEFQRIMREPIDKSQLTKKHRYRLGGAEYRAIDMLSKIVIIYYLSIIIIFGFLYRIYIAASGTAKDILRSSNENGPVDPWFFSFFMSLSALNNLGLFLLDASMVPFQNEYAPLIFTIILILAGNTAYAIFLRFIIWCLYKMIPSSRVMLKETFQYLLDHPRRCYTTLFPSTQTWWLLAIIVVITLTELISVLSLNYWLPALASLSWGSRIVDGLFQSVATRNAGFSVLNLGELNPGTQLVYMVAMYISVYPVAISMRNSNVYQERALGIYRGNDEDADDTTTMNRYRPNSYFDDAASGRLSMIRLKRLPTISSVMTTGRKVLKRPDFFVMTQIQRQLTSEICWLLVSIFAICVIEADAIMSSGSPITTASVIYECVSAFGNVGASLGYPDSSLSQVGHYHKFSKFVVILLMYRGRHRGLPAAIDRAVLLPSEQLEQKEVHDNIFRRRNTMASTSPSVMFYDKSRF